MHSWGQGEGGWAGLGWAALGWLKLVVEGQTDDSVSLCSPFQLQIA